MREKLLKSGIAGVIIFFLVLGLSQPTYIIYPDEDYGEYIERLFSLYAFPSLDTYYSSLEENTSFYKLVVSQLQGKEKAYFLQMRPYISEIAKASQKTGIPMASIASHIKRESQFDPQAVSSRGAYGLMGVTRWAYHDVARLRSKKDWIAQALSEYGELTWEKVKKNPEVNIVVGTIYYKLLLNQFKDTTLASLAYNWGMGNVYSMQEKYGDKEAIIDRLQELSSRYSAWVEPAKYPGYISDFKVIFKRVEERIKLAYATYKELHRENFTYLNTSQAQKNPSS